MTNLLVFGLKKFGRGMYSFRMYNVSIYVNKNEPIFQFFIFLKAIFWHAASIVWRATCLRTCRDNRWIIDPTCKQKHNFIQYTKTTTTEKRHKKQQTNGNRWAVELALKQTVKLYTVLKIRNVFLYSHSFSLSLQVRQ